MGVETFSFGYLHILGFVCVLRLYSAAENPSFFYVVKDAFSLKFGFIFSPTD